MDGSSLVFGRHDRGINLLDWWRPGGTAGDAAGTSRTIDRRGDRI
tara:strand:+ start:3944 stop:4078 length:135 start_codon:yes stop_codon:yes gene_type:complete